MSFSKLVLFCLLSFIYSPLFAQDEHPLLPPDEAFIVKAKAVSSDRLEVTWDIAEGYLLYKKSFRFESKTDPVGLGTPVFPEGKIKHDDMLGDVVHYRDTLTIPVPLIGAEGVPSLKVLVRYQGCADWGVCYPPQNKTLEIDLPQAAPLQGNNPFGNLVKGLSNIFPQPSSDELLPADQAFQFFASVKDPKTVHVSWLIADGYYLYREKFDLALPNAKAVKLGNYSIPRGTPKHDEEFGQVEVFYHELSFDLPLVRADKAAASVSLQAKFQGCAERGVCYPPMSKTVELELPVAETISKGEAGNTPAEAESEQDRIVRSLRQDSLSMALLSFFGFGLLLSFTPCVFPMIPILSGIIVGHRAITTMRAFLLSLSYVFASALTYTLFGILAAVFGSNLQATFQQPWIIALFSAIFVLLSLSMFGFYHLELPKSWQLKLHNAGERHRDGSLWGAAIMGALSSLIVGPCVAAPLAAALIYIGQTGDTVLGGSALFAMGMGMGVPLLILGASAGKLLPKAGEWLNSTKAVFGVLMLAVAVWMLDRILPAAVVMVLWAMLLIIPAIYLNAIDPLPPNSSGWRKLWKGVGMMMLSYGLLLLIGFSGGNTNPLQPLQGLSLAKAAQPETKGIPFERVANLEELEARIEEAGAANRMVMLDFYADWCISCKEMEAYTFTDPKVKEALAGMILLQADVTKNSDDDKALLSRFNLVGPPAILFFGTNGREKTSLRVIGYQDGATFMNTLQRAKL
ncbi:MAG: protein-disulfide reductase DsbD [Gammaproteobacteria bacterium]